MLEDPALWASFAWEVATPPVMTPGYLSWADPIENAFVFPGTDGCLGAEVVLRTPLPAQVPGWRTWEPTALGTIEETSGAEHLALARVTLTLVLEEFTPPAPPGSMLAHRELVCAAKAAVRSSAVAVEVAIADPC